MSVFPNSPVPNSDNGNYFVNSNDTIINKKVPNPYEKDTVEYKNEETFDREKINKEVMKNMQQEPDKKANILKVLFNKLFGKKPKQAEYNYDNNIPPYDK